ncbi:ABC transporter permease [Anaerobacillus alkaliphilus]|uniref:ABC transporter permease n=1 Tax=Anaerobacillus alkaliphilus TaxID=1548597 RepID=A0A4Q0VRX6_9BACI|nr:ABC transporter permease [Anaerobacillus alkaliphilus]RXI99836.1 ABC transporter permease [Anaerobacillus alkaliphilus]
MSAYWQLTLAQLKLFARNKAVIFWTTFFPLFLMIVLGLFLGGGTGTTINVAWVDHDKSDYSLIMKDVFLDVEAINLSEWNDIGDAKREVEDGNISFVIEIQQGFAQLIETEAELPILSVYYDETNQSIAQLGFAIIDQAVDQLNKQLTNYQEVVFVEREGLKSLDLTYLDFLVPGIAALMILSSNLNGVAAQISSWRERGVLRRMKLTGLPASTFVGAQITARAILNITQSILVISVGIFLLGAQMNGSWFLLLFYLILGILVFMSLGFLVANLAKTPEHASPIAGFISFPMFFLGGIFFPITNMPDILQPVIALIPISHLANVLREVMNVGATMGDLFLPTTILLAWFLVCFTIASKTFKWE